MPQVDDQAQLLARLLHGQDGMHWNFAKTANGGSSSWGEGGGGVGIMPEVDEQAQLLRQLLHGQVQSQLLQLSEGLEAVGPQAECRPSRGAQDQ